MGQSVRIARREAADFEEPSRHRAYLLPYSLQEEEEEEEEEEEKKWSRSQN